MNLEPCKTEIDGVEYEFTPLMATPARNMFDQLAKKFGPTIASFVESLNGDAGDVDIDTAHVLEAFAGMSESLGGAIRAFTSALTPEFHNQLLDTFLNHVRYRHEDGEMLNLTKQVRETMFGRALALETKILGWCLSEQYSDFFAPLRTALASAGGPPQAKKVQS
jgi:hypothetical protein